MSDVLRSASLTLRGLLAAHLQADPGLAAQFGGGGMEVYLNSPAEMVENSLQGLSCWLYRLTRDGSRLNDPPRRVAVDREEPRRFPAHLHYLLTPVVRPQQPEDGPPLEQLILGVALQTMHERTILSGPDLEDGFAGQDVELFVRFEPMDLEEITRVWDAQEESYQLCLAYQVGIVYVAPRQESIGIDPVMSVEPAIGDARLAGVGAS